MSTLERKSGSVEMRVASHTGGWDGQRWEWSRRLRQFLQVVQLTGHRARLHWETGTGWLLACSDLILHFIFPRKVWVITRDQLPLHLNHTML